MKKQAADKSIQARHNERRKKRIREQKLRRFTFFTVLALIAVFLIVFLTPIFNIKTVNIVGNERLQIEEITEQLGELEGKNLFAFGEHRIKKRILTLPYAEKVNFKKKLFPPSITIEVVESDPSFQVDANGKFAVADKNGKVLETLQEKCEGVAVLEGVSVVSANEGSIIEFKNNGVNDVILTFLKELEKAEMMHDITVISFEDIENITFNYQSRLDVICGNSTDVQRKLALFKEAVNSNKLTENSRGTINLSTTGKAIYTP